jgi:hypothetical protein
MSIADASRESVIVDVRSPGSSWGPERPVRLLDLAICSFGILALELTVIRWMSGQVRIFAYFTNILLIAAFLGMGLGVALGQRRPGLIHGCLPALAVLSVLLAFPRELSLMTIRFPDTSISLWGEEESMAVARFALATLAFMALFWLVTLIFVLASAPIGWLFSRLPPLTAYSADLAGSILGIVAMTALAAFGTSPPIWMAVAVIPFAWLSRRPLAIAAGAIAVVLAALSIRGALYSPYNRIDLTPNRIWHTDGLDANDWNVMVNRDFHQEILDLSARTVEAAPPDSQRRAMQSIYELPFRVQDHGTSALVVGAGTGNDVAAALRLGFRRVVSVEIDPRILRLGVALHPERPYSREGVIRVANDARAYFEQNPNERFDVVCYGLLDSHAMFSAMSTLRLDNYVYTVEGIRAGWSHVAPDGSLAISFASNAGPWMVARLVGLIHEATGIAPLVVPHRVSPGMSYLVGRHLDASRIPPFFTRVLRMREQARIRIPTDDWPFLYIRPGTFPFAYVVILVLIVLTAFFGIRRIYGADVAKRFDLALFLMGAGFMLWETRMVTELSLLFGSTWIVNSSVFFAILVMALAANLWVSRRPQRRIGRWYLPLAFSILVAWAVGAGGLNRLPLWERWVIGGLFHALPVAFAGIIFSSLLRRSENPSAALGSNLLGAVCGGALEYLSLLIGLRALALLALALYAGSFLAQISRGGRRRDAALGVEASAGG